jgi:ABC-type Na+ efflux pump permease subunit
MHPFLQELLETEWRRLSPAGTLEESELADVASAIGGMIVANREKLMNRLRVQQNRQSKQDTREIPEVKLEVKVESKEPPTDSE